MSALNLTPEEETAVLNALRAQATQYQAMFGSADAAIAKLIAKVEGQLPEPEPVEVAQAEAAAEAAFQDDVPHEQFTHEDDAAPAVE
jgi:predicted DNA-binding transcriptional regulator YafY